MASGVLAAPGPPPDVPGAVGSPIQVHCSQEKAKKAQPKIWGCRGGGGLEEAPTSGTREILGTYWFRIIWTKPCETRQRGLP